jgi:hypothetical protein
MKKIMTLITLTLITLLTISCGESDSSKDKVVSRNPLTEKEFLKTGDIYSIKAPKGILILGSEEHAKEILQEMLESFSEEYVDLSFNVDGHRYDVKKDDAGLYICKFGLSVVKVRISDVLCFGTALGLKDLKKDAKEGFAYMKDKIQKFKKDIKD